MRNHEFFAVRLEHEVPAFLRVLRAVPSDHFGYRPHEKSTSAGDLAWQIASEMVSLIDLLKTGVADYRPAPRPSGSEEMAVTFEEAAKRAVELARNIDGDRWKSPGKFLMQGQLAWEASVAEIAWGFLFDLVHHRGQLSVYLRLRNVPLPPIYGPTADEQ